MKIETIAIIGRSALGDEIAQLLAQGSLKVLNSTLEQDYSAVAEASDLVLEFLSEDFDLKSKVMRDCDAKCRRETILATTTPNPWITRLASQTTRPDRFVGINFVKHAPQGKLLGQVAKGLQTSPETVEACVEFLQKSGITPVKLEESPGFIIDRVMAAIVNEAALMYSTSLATIEDIDKMVKVCANWPLGPFEFADSIGIDKIVETLDTLACHLGPKYQPCFLLRRMIDAGWLGKKAGRGFYTYS
jgi:3-hydroxybutyryl-CoA dehydrogenase